MNKKFKLLTVLTVAIMIIACLGVLAACGDDNTDPDNNGGGGSEVVEPEHTFKLTFVDSNGNGIEGLEIQLCKLDSNGELEYCLGTTKLTNANGIVYFSEDEYAFSSNVYGIHVLNEDMNYTFDNTAHKTSVGVKDYTLELN